MAACDVKVSASASELRGLCLRDASGEEVSALVASAANTGGDGGLPDEEEEGGERRWLQGEAFWMYEMEGAGCITPLSLNKLVVAKLGARRDIADAECQAIICRFDMDGGDGVLSFDEFKTMMMG